MPYKPDRWFIGPVFGAITILSWAGFNVAAKAGINAGMSPAALSFLRYLTPGIIAFPLLIWLLCFAKHEPVPVYRIAVLAFLGGPFFGLLAVAGYQFAPLSYGLLFAPVAVSISGTLLGMSLLGERISSSRILGALIMFSGLALLVGFETVGIAEDWLFGVGLFVAAGTMWGAYTVLLRYWQIPVLEGTSAIASFGAIIAAVGLAPLARPSLLETDVTLVFTQILMQGIVGGVLSVVALMVTLRHLTAQTAAILPTLTPAVAMIIAWVVLGARPEQTELIGAAIVFLGFALSTRSGKPFSAKPVQSRSPF